MICLSGSYRTRWGGWARILRDSLYSQDFLKRSLPTEDVPSKDSLAIQGDDTVIAENKE